MIKYFVFLLTILFWFSTLSAQNPIGERLHALHYSIHLTEINTASKTISAYTKVSLISKLNNLEIVDLELKDLTVDSVLTGQFQQDFYQTADTLKINLPVQANAGDTLDFTVYYHGNPFHENWGGFHFNGNYAFNLGVGFESIPHNLGKTWFPCIDDFTDRATYDIYVTMPNDKKAISAGNLIEITDIGNGNSIWHWKTEYELPTYLISIMAGDYILYEDEFWGMTDTVPITIYTRPSEAGKVEGSFARLKDILHFFEEKFGPYPFERVGYTGTAIGAMEHAANISYPHSSINGNNSNEWLYTHELSHMWFGDKVTCSSAGDMWLNEGWATFCEKYYKAGLDGNEVFKTEMRALNHEVLQHSHTNDGGYWALNNIPQLYTYGSTAYKKGGSVANTLRGYLGDSIFFQAISAYLDHYAYQSVSSEQMRDFLTDYTGMDMTGFFNAWVFTPGTPHFSIDSTKIMQLGSDFEVDLFLKQKYKGADFLAENNIIEIGFVDEQFHFQTDTVHFSGRTGHSVKTLPFFPVAVFIDPNEKIGDATNDNYRFFEKEEEYVFPDTYFKLTLSQLSDSALIRVTHNWAAPDTLKTPVDGLRLSPYRYWTIEGVFPENMLASGRFFYDRGNSLDDGLILSENDSIVILYRQNAWDEWHEIDQARQGSWLIGYIVTAQLLPGEYTLAVWDKQLVSVPEIKVEEVVNIYPNPSKGNLTFEFEKKGNYEVFMFDTKGSLLEQFTLNGKKRTWKWEGKGAFTGVVLFRFVENNEIIANKKLIFN